MLQIISKDGMVVCMTAIPYPNKMVKNMKQAGYKFKNVEDHDLQNDVLNRMHVDSAENEAEKYNIDWFDLGSEEGVYDNA